MNESLLNFVSNNSYLLLAGVGLILKITLWYWFDLLNDQTKKRRLLEGNGMAATSKKVVSISIFLSNPGSFLYSGNYSFKIQLLLWHHSLSKNVHMRLSLNFHRVTLIYLAGSLSFSHSPVQKDSFVSGCLQLILTAVY